MDIVYCIAPRIMYNCFEIYATHYYNINKDQNVKSKINVHISVLEIVLRRSGKNREKAVKINQDLR